MRGLGYLKLEYFVTACVGAVADFKRINVDVTDFKRAALLFVDDAAIA